MKVFFLFYYLYKFIDHISPREFFEIACPMHGRLVQLFISWHHLPQNAEPEYVVQLPSIIFNCVETFPNVLTMSTVKVRRIIQRKKIYHWSERD